MLEGTLHFLEGGVQHELAAGDCLQLGAPADCVFSNPGSVDMPLPRGLDAALNVEGPAGESGAFDQAGCRGVSAVTKSVRRGART